MSTNDRPDQPANPPVHESSPLTERIDGLPPGGAPATEAGDAADSVSAQVIQDLRSLSPEDPDGFLVEMIDLFQTDAAQYLARIAESARTGNATAVKKTAHGLKGSSGNLGAKKMSALCHQIEIAASEAVSDWTTINSLMTELDSEAARVRRAFEFLRNQAIQPK